MSPSCRVLAALFIALTAAQVCTGEERGSLNHNDVASIIAAIKEVGKTLERFETTLNQGLRYHQLQNNDVMKVLQTLPDMLKEQLVQQNSNSESTSEKMVAASEKVEALVEQFKEVKTYVMNKDKADELTEEIEDLKKKLEKKDETVRDLENRLAESTQQVKNLSNNEKRLNNTVEQLTNSNAELNMKVSDSDNKAMHQNKRKDQCHVCRLHQQQPKINELVQAFNNNDNWYALNTGLQAVLDHSSEVYKELQSRSSTYMPFWYIGEYNNHQLASLLLCAGLPVDADNSYTDTMLHGAANGGHVQLAELLLQHGADVNFKGTFNYTPVMRAVHGDKLEMVRWLVEAGADTTARDMGGRTALKWAKYNSRTSIIPYLEQLPH